jgi:AraC-like DNA-binding protein
MLGIKISEPNDKKIVKKYIDKITSTTGLKRLTNLFECLDYIANIKNLPTLSNESIVPTNTKNGKRIDTVFNYTINSYSNQITLDIVANLIHMSVPAFCKFFKQSTRKTYIQYLNEIRIGNACNLLQETELSVNEIGYSCGYNTLANFHKQFLKIKNTQPHVYRKQFNSFN